MSVRPLLVVAMIALFAIPMLLAPGNIPTASAQNDPALDQLLRSADGNVSVRVPSGWVWEDNSGDPAIALFSSQIWWGDSQSALDTRLEFNRLGTGNVVGLGGGVVLADNDAFTASFGYYPDASELMDILKEFNEGGGATVEEPSETTIGTLSGYFTVVNSATINNEIMLMVTADSPVGTILILSSGTAENTNENAGLLNEIALSVRAPAEADSSSDNTPDSSPNNGNELPTFDNLSPLTTASAEVSIQVPVGWLGLDLSASGEGFYFGDSQEAIESRVENFRSEESLPVVGVGGTILLFPYADVGLSGAAPSGFPVDFVDGILSDLTADGSTIVFDLTDFNVINNNQGALLGLEAPTGTAGWLAVMTFDEVETMVLMSLTADSYANFEAQFIELAGLIDTVRLPAESDAAVVPTSFEGDAPGTDGSSSGDTPGLGDVFGPGGNNGSNSGTDTGTDTSSSDTGAALPPGSQRYSTNDGSISIVLPEGWVVFDDMAGQNLFVIGDSQEAIDTRITNFNSADDPAPVVGSGVLIGRFSLDELGAANPVPAGYAVELATSLVPNFEEDGGLVIFPVAEIYSDANIQVARYGGIRSTNLETGFQAVVSFNNERTLLAIIATASDSASFTTQYEILESALISARVSN